MGLAPRILLSAHSMLEDSGSEYTKAGQIVSVRVLKMRWLLRKQLLSFPIHAKISNQHDRFVAFMCVC